MDKRLFKQLSLSFLLLFFVAPLFGQFPGQGGGGFGGNTQSGGTPQGEFIELIDTFGVYYFFVDNPNEETPFSDTLLRHFQQYDVTRNRDFEYAHLGNPGSPARPLFFQPAFRRGFDIGLHQFDLYRIDKKNTPYYRLENPFTRAYYSQNNKDNLNFKGEYSRNFSDGINVSIYALRSNHLGQFRNQRARNTAFANNWWYHDKKGKYDGYLALTSNSNVHQDNGGIVPIPENLAVANPITLPVNIDDGSMTKHTQRSFTYTQYYKLIGAVPVVPAQPEIKTQRGARPPGTLPPSNLTPKDSLMLDSLMQRPIPEKKPADLGELMTKDSLLLPIIPTDSLISDSIVINSIVTDSVIIDSVITKLNPADSIVTPAAPILKDTLLQDSIQKDSVRGERNSYRRFSTDSLGVNGPGGFRPPPPISTGPPKRAITLGHQIAYHSNRYLFSDTSPDEAIYDEKYLTHDIGIRNYIRHQKVENDFRISTFKLRNNNNKVRKQRDLLEAGIMHTLHFVTQENEQRTLNNLFLHGRFNFNPKDRLKIKTYFHYGFLTNLGDYRLNGTLEYNLPTLGSLEVGLVQQAYSPSLIANRLILSETVVWENDFNKIFETSLKATLRVPRFDFEISGHYHLINNYQYFGDDGTPEQTGTAISVGQLMIKKHFKFWKLHLDNKIILQQNSSGSILRMPRLLTKQSFYFAGYLLKKALFSHVGVDFRLNDDFIGDAYFAPTGQFQLQNQQILRAYPLLDVFVDFKVKEFRFFAKYENLTRTWYPATAFQTYLHPERYTAFRFGVSWRFLN